MAAKNKPVAQVVSLSVSFNVACVFVLSLRFLAMHRIRKSIKMHDWLCIAALVLCVGFSIDMIVGAAYGDTFFASQFFWAFSTAAFRLSILLVYLELFNVGNFFYYAYAMIGVVCLFFIECIATTLRLCQPIRFSWDKTIQGSCGDIAKAEMAAAAFNLVMDIFIVLLPLPLVWGLHITKQKKITLTITLALGLIIAAINLGRIIQVQLCDVQDFTYCTHSAILLTIPEMAVGVIVSCAPLLGPIFFSSRYKERETSRYAHLHDEARNRSAKKVHEGQTLESRVCAADAIELLTPEGERSSSRGVGAHSDLACERAGTAEPKKKGHVSEGRIGVETDIRVTIQDAR